MAVTKGITIEFRGDATNLNKAINSVRKETKSLDQELQYINNSLKFNPGNMDLIKQKMTVLQQAADKSEDNVKDLKKALQEMKDSGVDETSDEYRELQREIIRTESKQKQYNKELRKLKAESSALGQLATKFSKFGSAAQKAGQALKPLSTAAAAVDVAIGAMAVKSGKAADELMTLSKQTGVSTDDLQMYAAAADLVDVSVETMAKSQVKLKKSMSSAEQGSKKMSRAFKTLGVDVTDSNGELRDQSEVFDEVIAALGSMTNETERDAIAMQIFGGNATELNSLIKDGGETYKKVADIYKNNGLEIVDEETLQKANEFNDSIDTIKMTAQAALSNVGTQLAGYLAPAMEKISEAISKIMGWLSQLDPAVLTTIAVIAGVIAALAPVLIIVGKISMAISSIMTLMSTIGPVIAGVAGPIAIAIAAVAALIAIGVLLYKNWDKIKAKAVEIKDWVVKKWTELKTKVEGLIIQLKTKVLMTWEAIKAGIIKAAIAVATFTLEKFNAIKTKVTSIFSSIKSTAVTIWGGIKKAITTPIQTAFRLIKTIVEKIKGLFSNMKISFPHIKTPHFSISPPGWKIGDLLEGKLPKLGIEWYKKGGIFQSPSVIGVGEAGAEAVLPIEKLKGMLQEMNSGTVINVYASPGMDVNELADKIQAKIIANQKRRNQAWA